MNKTIRLLLWVSGFIIMASGLLAPIYAVFVQNIGGDLLTAGTAYGVYALCLGILIFFLSRWEDKIKNQNRILIFGYFLAVVGFSGYLYINKPWHLFLVQAILGIAEAIRTPIWDGLYSRNLSKGKEASIWGYYESMKWITTAASAALGGFIANTFGFMVLFYIMSLLSLGSFLTSLFLLKK